MDYLFYRIYIWNYPKEKDRMVTAFNALCGISFLTLLNLHAIFQIYLYQTNGVYPEVNNKIKAIALAVAFSILGLYCYYFLKNKRYLNVITKFENESEKQRTIGTIKIGLYIFLSFLIPMILAGMCKSKGIDVA